MMIRNRIFYTLEVILWTSFVLTPVFGLGGFLQKWGAQWLWSVVGINSVIGILFVPRKKHYDRAMQMPFFMKDISALWAADYPGYCRRWRRVQVGFSILGIVILVLVILSVFQKQ